MTTALRLAKGQFVFYFRFHFSIMSTLIKFIIIVALFGGGWGTLYLLFHFLR